MKKSLFLFGVSLMLGISTYAQDCPGMKSKKDAFTNKTEKTGRVVLSGSGLKWSVDLSQSEGKSSMKWGIAMNGEANQKIEKGTPLLLKLEDGSVVTIPTSETSSPVTQAASGGAGTVYVYSVYYLNFDLPKETLQKLAKSPITDLKIDVPGQELKSPKVKGKQTGKLQEMFTCLYNS
ncbi:hypothetical protein [Polluticoccus soli]|uniref:hypothetical protein n=1 Tax=Polluticoccus soli TaxID=3034150 RepID=UPI0023E0ED41|nr:hypothetical protein [Flavipsychrobacter sp. JY13-12]